MKLNKIIGIISWFPDNPKVKAVRKRKLHNLINDCNRLFDLPIMIVAQEWTQEELENFDSKHRNLILVDIKEKLGITGARKKLRELFLKSGYDYLIMLDDDIELFGDSGKSYLAQIDANPDCFIENNKSRLQLFAISKYCFERMEFDDISAEKGEGFEDRIFFYTLKNKMPDRYRKFFNTGVREHALGTADPNSTWYKTQDVRDMVEKSNELIEKRRQEIEKSRE